MDWLAFFRMLREFGEFGEFDFTPSGLIYVAASIYLFTLFGAASFLVSH